VNTNAQQEEIGSPSCVLRLFGAPAGAVRRAVAALPGECMVRARALTRGGETLLLLEAGPGQDGEIAPAERLRLAVEQLRASLAEAAYGQGEQTLPAAAVEALVQRDLLLVCADAATGALLEPRLEALDVAERVFDFGAQSYLHPKHAARIAAAGRKWAERTAPENANETAPEDSNHDQPEAAARQAVGRLQMARRLTEADLAAASVPLLLFSTGAAGETGAAGQGTLLLLGRKKGLWMRVVPPGEAQNPALWLLDMIRRAAAGLEQADGTRWARYGEPLGLQDQIELARAQSSEASDAECPARIDTGTPWVVERGEPMPAQPAPIERSRAEPAAGALTPKQMQKQKGRRPARRVLFLALFLVLLAAAACAAWQYTGGSWEALRKSLGLKDFSLSGASLL
jgi:hypothetical protein